MQKEVHFEKYTSNLNSMIIFEVFSHHLLSDVVEVGVHYPCPTVEVYKESRVSPKVIGNQEAWSGQDAGTPVLGILAKCFFQYPTCALAVKGLQQMLYYFLDVPEPWAWLSRAGWTLVVDGGRGGCWSLVSS